MNSSTPRIIACLAIASAALFAQSTAPLMPRDMSLVRLGSAAELKAPVAVPRGYAVVIGISTYQNATPDKRLPFAERDAESLYSALISKEGGQLEFENIRKLIGRDATLANIRTTLEEWLPARVKEGDRVVVYFVGHGLVDDAGLGYLAPYDVDPRRVAQTGYPMARLGEVLSTKVKAGWKMLFVDACHSGQLTVSSTSAKVNETLRGLPQGFLTLTSSRASESSYEDPKLGGGNGVFTYFLVRGWLGESDADPADGKVTADELVTYVKREVRAYVRKQGGQQTPLEFGDFPDDLLLAYSPTRRSSFAGRTAEVANGSIVVEANLDNVEVYVDDKRAGIAAPNAPLRLPGLAAGNHTVRGVRSGYEPVSLDINVAPGSTQTVSLRLIHQRVPKAAAKTYYDEGEAIWKRSRSASTADLAKAENLLASALKEDGSYGAAALELCRVQQAAHKTSDALKTCRRAVQIESADAEARTMLGVLLLETGDYPEAVRQLQTASTQDPHNSFVQSAFAEALYFADRPEESERAADRAVTLNPSSGQAYLLRAEAKRAQSHFDDAIADYNRALSVQEFDSGTLRTAAFWIVGMGMRKNRSGYRALYKTQASAAYFGLCASEIGRQDFRRAVQQCGRALAVDKADPDTHNLLAEAYAGLFSENNRRQYLLDARQNVQESLRINPAQASAAALQSKLKEIDEILPTVH